MANDILKVDRENEGTWTRNSSISIKNQSPETKKVQLEDVGEISEDNDEKERLDDEIRDFVKKGQMDIKSRKHMMKPMVPGSP
jgi:hypothetical protein